MHRISILIMNSVYILIVTIFVYNILIFLFFFFFFQAEDGIRDGRVTGVQTCALPICTGRRSWSSGIVLPLALSEQRRSGACQDPGSWSAAGCGVALVGGFLGLFEVVERVVDARSEERRVGKGCRSRGWVGG